MRTRGRKRKPGADRHPNGRIVHKPQEDIIPAAALARRQELVGKVEYATTIGTAPKVLEEWGVLTRRQREAAETYRLVYIAWACLNDMPGRHPLSPSGEGRLDDLLAFLEPDERLDREKKIMRRFSSANDEIAPGLARATIDMIVIEDWEPEVWRRGIVAPRAVQLLQETLDRLAELFQIPERERVDGRRELVVA